MQTIHLYIDHQSLAPLIHALEDVVEYEFQAHHLLEQKYQLRRRVYQEFLSILNTLYLERASLLKHEEMGFKLEEQFPKPTGINDLHPQKQAKRVLDCSHQQKGYQQRIPSIKTRGKRKLEIEVELMQWMIGCDKNIFDKKEIVEKYSELCGGSRKNLSTDKLLKMMEKYKLWNVIIRGKHGEEHFLKFDMNSSIATVIKREEFSKEMSRIMLDQQQPFEGLWSHLPQNLTAEKREEDELCKEVGQVDADNYALLTGTRLQEGNIWRGV